MNTRRIETHEARLMPPPSAPLERQRGKIGWLLLWLVGIPVPVLIGLFLLRGCT
jgi:hypothetical protein